MADNRTAQPAPETEAKPSRGLGSYVLWGFVVVMVYVLSSGPVVRLHRKLGREPMREKIIYIYAPLFYAYRQPRLRKPLGMYWHLWAPAAFDENGEEVLSDIDI